MFTTIFQSLANMLGESLDSFIRMFLEQLNVSLDYYLKIFPLLSVVYSALQSVAVGLLVLIAGYHLATFWLGSVDSSAMNDRPVNILLRSFIAAAGIYFGGYVLQFLVELGTVPYDYFMSMDTITTSTSAAMGRTVDVGSKVLMALGTLSASASAAQAGAPLDADAAAANAEAAGVLAENLSLTDGALAMLSFLIIVLLAINIFKLAIEVCERYMMVGLLVFTSPIVYPTISTKETSQIFKKWVGMFVGSLIMMSMSVVFLKIIVNAMNSISENGEGLVGTLFMILATTKIAQRVDTYMQQLGIGVATTGGNMVDDVLALAHSMRRTRGASKSSVLGGTAANIAARTPLGAGVKKTLSDISAGRGIKESFKAGAAAAKKHWEKNSLVGGAASALDKAEKQAKAEGRSLSGGEKAAAVAGGAAKGAASGVATTVAPKFMAGQTGIKTGAEQNRLDAREQEKAERAEEAAKRDEAHRLEKESDKAERAEEAAKRDEARSLEKEADKASRAEKAMLQDNKQAVQAYKREQPRVGDGDLPQEVVDKVNSDKDISRGDAISNREQFGLGAPDGAFLVNENGDVDVNDKIKAAGGRIDDNGVFQSKDNGTTGETLARMTNSVGNNIGDQTMDKEERDDIRTAQGAITSNSIAAASSTAVGYALNSRVRVPDGNGASSYSVQLAQKHFGGVLPQTPNNPTDTISSYKQVDNGYKRMGNGYVDGGRSHFVGTTNGKSYEIADERGYAAKTEEEKSNYTRVEASDGRAYYMREIPNDYPSSPSETAAGPVKRDAADVQAGKDFAYHGMDNTYAENPLNKPTEAKAAEPTIPTTSRVTYSGDDNAGDIQPVVAGSSFSSAVEAKAEERAPTGDVEVKPAISINSADVAGREVSDYTSQDILVQSPAQTAANLGYADTSLSMGDHKEVQPVVSPGKDFYSSDGYKRSVAVEETVVRKTQTDVKEVEHKAETVKQLDRTEARTEGTVKVSETQPNYSYSQKPAEIKPAGNANKGEAPAKKQNSSVKTLPPDNKKKRRNK